ncbi:MAG: hypothetical protein WCW31_05565 [Patescibacteria group bacterium]|jgi:hypothetical protein
MWRKLFGRGQGLKALPGFFWQVFFGLNQGFEALSPADLVRKRRRQLAVKALLICLVILIVVAMPAFADDGTTMGKIGTWILALLTQILIFIIKLLGYLVMALVDILIKIVQYNTFVNAFPVRVGWPIMRDTVNMFFIIVVLVSAFATIIGYPKDFHYRQILPKLLLMAVLINFSKTLIGLMIDFSQVILLTFVNGFKQAAGGNFIQALHIGDIMKFQDTNSNAILDKGGGVIEVDRSQMADLGMWSVVSIFVAALFGAWILSICITLLVIMVIFFIARIIILWILLITSPIMFFAWALPSQLKKAFSAFTDDWWSRLSSALIGGPVMAFFLWLSLALAANQNEIIGTDAGIYKENKTAALTAAQEAAGGLNIVNTKIGSPENFAGFIVMVAFMLLGVQVAVKTAGTLAPKLGGLAGTVAAQGGMFGAGAALTAFTARTAAKAGKKGIQYAGKGAAGLEARVGLKSKLAEAALGSKFIPKTQGMRTSLAAAATAHRREGATKATEFEKAYGSLTPELQMQQYRAIAGGSAITTTKAEKAGAQIAIAKLAASKPYRDKLMDSKEKELEKDKTYAGDDNKLARKARARAMANEEIGQQLDRSYDEGKKHNLPDLLKTIDEAREKDPSLFIDEKKAEMASKMASDPAMDNKIQDNAFMDGNFAFNYAKAKGWVDQTGNKVKGLEFRKDYQDFRKGRQGQLMDAHFENFKNSADGRARVGTLLSGTASAQDLAASNYNVNVGKDGKDYYVTHAGGTSKQAYSGETYDAKEVTENIQDATIKGNLQNAATAAGVQNVGDAGRRLNDQSAGLLTTTLVQMQGGQITKPQAVEQLMEQNIDVKLLGNTVTGVEKQQAIQSAFSGTKSGAFANSIAHATSAPDLAMHAQNINLQSMDQLQKIVQASRGNPELANKIQGGLRRMVVEAEKIEATGYQAGSGNADNDAILQAVDAIKKDTSKPGIQVNRFTFQGHS